ncbi:class I ribonucleotide reductase maintenance protein YfaE [Catenovulum maritimum]|uniref:Ferredoxin n=1 Tax=Catenovulum maritimum TaxID=1513271 RepID=A0A0J8H0J7_9ALTE|nr:class I ribonucleotide reductase maintenance protein YfaE [Catenovulum maritimum]KMT66523.1 ferredoxin [Catenovulum maritimum]
MSCTKVYNLVKEDYVTSNKTCVLDYLEQQEFHLHYHCRDGYCGACRTVLKQGEIEYPKEPLAFIRRGEFLPCCSIPKSDLIIEIENID